MHTSERKTFQAKGTRAKAMRWKLASLRTTRRPESKRVSSGR